ncbi:MAG: FAD-binding oxidoreductase [Alphaproteobacteria bacterium]|nr:FAD-binding oxidoreductase [Alphaproteobacteria bacterium]
MLNGFNQAAEELRRIVGADHVITDPAECRVYSNDIFFWDDAHAAEIVVQPANAAEVSDVVKLAARRGLSIYTRGGGMSYTKGYVPAVEGAVLIDMRRINQVFEINPVDRYVVVGAGCTWEKLAEALKPHGLKLVFLAPFSGIYSTVGGALSQNVPASMKGILGLEIVRADGAVLRTGAWGRNPSHGNAAPFFRDYGPDLTGLFLGDTGSFAIKTAAVLHLYARPAGAAHASFAFETYEDMAATMIDLGTFDYLYRRVGLDPFKSQNSVKVGFKEALKTLGAVSGSGTSALGGLKDTVKMAAQGTTDFMAGVKWSMHLSSEALDERAAEAGMDAARNVALKRGREIANVLPRAMEARGFSVRGFLGGQGQRWVPTNSLWPLSRAVEVASKVQGFFNARRPEMQKHGIWESYMTNWGQGYFQCEPSFYWVDEVSELHLRHLGKEEADKFRELKPNLPARAFAKQLRHELRDFFFDLGAVHVQLAKFYRFQESLAPETARMLGEVKQMLDPDRRLNPGNLGLGK